MRVVWVLPDIGGYHYARMVGVISASDIKLHIIQVFARSGFDEFQYTGTVDAGINIDRLDFNSSIKDKQVSLFNKIFKNALKKIRPDVVCVPGWSEWYALSALAVAHGLNVPVVILSETTVGDFRRFWWKEWIKERILSTCSSALVGGGAHVEYLKSLGFPSKLIFTGYDTVDNDYFLKGAEYVRSSRRIYRASINVDGKFFLCSARFIEKKNISRLIEAFAIYQDLVVGAAGHLGEPWRLVILGDGALRKQYEQSVERLGLSASVALPGFKSYDQLPVYYGLASAFILASTSEQWGLVVNEAMAAGLPILVSERCGCASDLVTNGQNGFTFDPYDTAQLADLMFEMSSGAADLRSMGQQSQRIISGWSTKKFADGLVCATAVAFAAHRKAVGWFARTLLWVLMRR